MSKVATKARNNVFCLARYEAAKYNDLLNSREGASEVTGIDRNRIANIELGNIVPYPEEVVVFADAYNAPELLNHFCTNMCPIGKNTMQAINTGSFSELSMMLLASTREIGNIREAIIDICADGQIDNDELKQVDIIIKKLKRTALDIESLEVLYKKLKRKGGDVNGTGKKR